jgi:hypothetical protein
MFDRYRDTVTSATSGGNVILFLPSPSLRELNPEVSHDKRKDENCRRLLITYSKTFSISLNF